MTSTTKYEADVNLNLGQIPNNVSPEMYNYLNEVHSALETLAIKVTSLQEQVDDLTP